jgi:hypothetical protein
MIYKGLKCMKIKCIEKRLNSGRPLSYNSKEEEKLITDSRFLYRIEGEYGNSRRILTPRFYERFDQQCK